nr:quinol:electron acceptor oxidoreductase subunit ActD [Roseomonas acroporae]
MGWLFVEGIGIWGVNTSVVWGFAIANYVWWIGIGNAGTFISAALLLLRQPWRAAINRFAEVMTLFAGAIAGLFPIMHLGRPYRAYWLLPYPNSMELWPQWRSALVWDCAAIATYLLFSLVFWWLGLLPDLATLRDRAPGRAGRLAYGVLALGWRGSARHWHLHDRLYRTLAMLALPLVVSVHSVVGMDFAASLMPGWEESIFPPYFVVGALFSGFGMCVVLAALLRWGLGLQAVITQRHFAVMAKVILAGALVLGLSYLTEWFTAWYSGDADERGHVRFLFGGEYAPLYYVLLACNVLVPQVLWSARARRSIGAVVAVSLLLNLGMWLERVLIIWNVLSHGYLPSMHGVFRPTFWDWALLAGTIGFFLLLFLVFARLLPVIAMHDLGKLLFDRQRAEAHAGEEDEARAGERPGGAGRGARPMGGAPPILAEFRDPLTLIDAAHRAREAGLRGLDAHTPFAVAGLAEALALPTPRVRPAMLAGGLLAAAFVYALCWYSAVLDYPLVLGGRPLHGWQVFLVLTFEAGILGATFTGVAWFLVAAGLPRLNHPVFDARDIGRASQDRFFLAVADPAADEARLAALLDGLGPLSIRRVAP